METASGEVQQGAPTPRKIEGKPTPRAIIYARVSTDDQAASGLGVEAQIHAGREWARREGRVVAAVHTDDGIGGATELARRPALIELLSALQPGDVVVVAKRDRIGRDPIVVSMVEAAVGRKGARIVSAAGEGTASDEPTDVLMRRIVDGFGEYERLVIRSRTKAALAAKRRRGERISRTPYGCDLAEDNKTLVANVTELATIGVMVQWRQAGLTFRQIAAELSRQGVPTKRAAAGWSHSSIISILRRFDEQQNPGEDD